ncbi:hypothetical protein P7K49_032525 [Saguinus oedipus]|uniref:Uncharacterized protein n=1 Tax=Saguinus oedipus TaxID=9490 RepID=A0ABQ9TZB0_SAGOE|nr:hypothetical protein P7K49_032525 [Saguinus oedipus]
MRQATFSAARGGFRGPEAEGPDIGRSARPAKRSPIHSPSSILPPRGPRGGCGARLLEGAQGAGRAAAPLPPRRRRRRRRRAGPLGPPWSPFRRLSCPAPRSRPTPDGQLPLTCLSRYSAISHPPPLPPPPTLLPTPPTLQTPAGDVTLARRRSSPPRRTAVPNQARRCLYVGGTHARSAFSALVTRPARPSPSFPAPALLWAPRRGLGAGSADRTGAERLFRRASWGSPREY